jgi:hypothetical protein
VSFGVRWGGFRDVPFRAERQRQKRRAHVRDDASDDELLLACGADRGTHLGAVPRTSHADMLARCYDTLVELYSVSLNRWSMRERT